MASRRRPASEPPLAPEMELLIRILDESYEKKAWHGPNLRGSIRGLPVERAVWRPGPDRHSIAEHVIHAAYGSTPCAGGSEAALADRFRSRGSNWFPVLPTLTQTEWKSLVELLESEHRTLREVILRFPAERLHEKALGGKVTNLATTTGIAAHDVYHAGQIQLLKRLQDRS